MMTALTIGLLAFAAAADKAIEDMRRNDTQEGRQT